MKSKQLTIHSDGGSRGNPGPAAYGFVITDEDGTLVYEEGKYIGIDTNNVAEYSGVLNAFQWILDNKPTVSSITCVLDSELVTRQLSGIYKIKNENLRVFYLKIKGLEKQIGVPITYSHVLRAYNKAADKLVNQALDTQADL